MKTKTGLKIRDLRVQQNMTQDDLASMLNVTKAAVSKWENGHNLPDTIILTKMTELFQVPLSELIGAEDQTEEVEREAEEQDVQDGARNAEEGDLNCEEDPREKRSLCHDPDKRWVIFAVSALMLLIAAWLLLQSAKAYRETKLSWDLSGLQIVKTLEMEEGFVIAGKRYEPYTYLDAKSYDTLAKFGTSSYTLTGKVIAYRGTEGGTQMNYYMTVGTMVGDWLLMYRDDHKTGKPSAETALYLYCTAESRELAPDWLKTIHQN